MKRQLAAITVTLISLISFVGCTAENNEDAIVNADVETLSPDNPKGKNLRAGTGGGGGASPRNHHSTHPLDLTIPIVIAGGQVARTTLPTGSSLLDVPATVAWALGIQPPASWDGRPLHEAFAPVEELTAPQLAVHVAA